MKAEVFPILREAATITCLVTSDREHFRWSHSIT